MTTRRILPSMQSWVATSIAFFMGVLVIRFYELVSVTNSQSALIDEWRGLAVDLLIALPLMVPIALVSLVTSVISFRLTFALQALYYAVLLLISWISTHYFVISGVTLGADLLGYSWNDIQTTVFSSGSVSWAGVVSLIALISSFIAINVWFYNKNSFYALRPLWIVILIVSCALGTSLVPEGLWETQSGNKTPKGAWLVADIIQHRNQPIAKPESLTEYPFLHTVSYEGRLSHLLDTVNRRPNVVIIIVEGLGRDFVGPDATYGGMMPFLDSLSSASLFWKNTLSNAGRTFGAPPSILGSLPYGRSGFMNYGADMPAHQTLISLLKKNGYSSNFFYGGNPNFDNLDLFLEYQQTDLFVNESNLPASLREGVTSSWGLPDEKLFDYAIAQLPNDSTPRLDMYLTLSTHEPFVCPDQNIARLADQRLTTIRASEIMLANRNIFQCLFYTDQALRKLIAAYKSRPDFNETLFVITGDHRMIPMASENPLNRYHVPLILFSPMVQKPTTFASLSTHAAITPTLTGWLYRTYGLSFPSEMPFISDELSLDTTFSSTLDIALMRTKNVLDDYVSGTTFLTGQRVFKIHEDLSLEEANSSGLSSRLTNQLNDFASRSIWACDSNRVDRIVATNYLVQFTLDAEANHILENYSTQTMNPEQQFSLAQDFAARNDFGTSRVILMDLLNRTPNFHDARILLARTYAWQSKFDSAEALLRQTLVRAPAYEDAYVAFADVEFWKGSYQASYEQASRGLAVNPSSTVLREKEVRARQLLNSK